MDFAEYEQRIKELERANRILQKKLERSEADRIDLEVNNDKKQALLKSVIRELEESKTILEERSQILEQTLKNLQTMQAKLVASEKMSALGILVAGVAHEINNPVNFIYGNLIHAQKYIQDLLKLVQLYQQHYPTPSREIQEAIADIELDFLIEDLANLLKSMNLGTERIREIVRSLRNFSHVNEARLKVVDIHEGLDSTLMILHNRLKANSDHPGIEVIKEYGQLPLIECYPGQLNQVFMNLLTNAIDAMEQGSEEEGEGSVKNSLSSVLSSQGSIPETQYPSPREMLPFGERDRLCPTISICTQIIQDNWVAIRITDNGQGMSEDVRSKLFDPFFTTKPVGKGTGLGLSISYQIVVERHGGKMQCHSAPGQGTEFVIHIPIQQSR
jgi:signal transduction histidine kinase